MKPGNRIASSSINGHIHAIFFDLDGTLRYDDPSSHHTFFDFAVQLGVKDLPINRIAALRWAHAYWANIDQTVENDIAQFGGPSPEFWQNYSFRYLLAYGCEEEQAQALAPEVRVLMAENHNPTNTLAQDAHPTLTALQEQGYTLGVITNRSRPCLEEIEMLGIAHYFDLILTAGEVNAYKPDPAIFEHALARADAKPQNSLYIGDNYYADIVGAERAGLVPVLIDPEHVFSDVNCLIIENLSDLHALLNHG